MKKLCIIIFSICCISFSIGEDIPGSGIIEGNNTGKTIMINQSLDVVETSNIKNIKFMFCNDPDQKKRRKELFLDIRPQQTKEICLAFFNVSDKPIDLVFGFAHGWKNQDGGISCDQDISENNQFSKTIRGESFTGMTVPAQGSLIKKVMYRSPKDATGQTLGCAIFKLASTENIVFGKMFLLEMRNASYIYINNTGGIYAMGLLDDAKYALLGHKDTILKTIIAILTILIIVTIFKKDTKNKTRKAKK